MNTASDTKPHHRIGLLSYAPVPQARFDVMKQRLSELGYREGVNVDFECRSSDRDKAATAHHARELIAMDVDLIWAMNTNAAVAVREAMSSSGGKTIPTVFWATDPVEAGIVESFDRRGSFTGFAAPCDLQLLQVRFVRATWPQVTRIPLLYNPTYGPAPSAMRQLTIEAELYGMSVELIDVATREDLEPAIDALALRGGQLFLVGPHALFNTNGALIGGLALERRLAVVAVQESVVRGGGIVSFFPSGRAIQTGILSMVDRILKGTTPEAIPIDRKIGFTCMVNRRAATRLGLEIPGFLLAEADEIVD